MAEKLKALVVHGDPAETGKVSEMLARADFDVEHAPHGPAAFASLMRGRFDLIVTEIKLKRLDGFHVIQAAKNLASPAKIIALSGQIGRTGARTFLDLARKLGAHGTMEKPHKPSHLWNLLRIMFPREVAERRRTPRN